MTANETAIGLGRDTSMCGDPKTWYPRHNGAWHFCAVRLGREGGGNINENEDENEKGQLWHNCIQDEMGAMESRGNGRSREVRTFSQRGNR